MSEITRALGAVAGLLEAHGDLRDPLMVAVTETDRLRARINCWVEGGRADVEDVQAWARAVGVPTEMSDSRLESRKVVCTVSARCEIKGVHIEFYATVETHHAYMVLGQRV